MAKMASSTTASESSAGSGLPELAEDTVSLTGSPGP